MNSDWEQVNQLFHQALSVDLAERNRLLARINQEIMALGPVRRNATTTSREFADNRRTILGLAGPSAASTTAASPVPSTARAAERFVTLEHSLVHIDHPES